MAQSFKASRMLPKILLLSFLSFIFPYSVFGEVIAQLKLKCFLKVEPVCEWSGNRGFLHEG